MHAVTSDFTVYWKAHRYRKRTGRIYCIYFNSAPKNVPILFVKRYFKISGITEVLWKAGEGERERESEKLIFIDQ